MDDILLIQLLKKKGIISDRDIHEFHELTTAGFEAEPVYLSKQSYIEKAQEFRHMNEEESKELVSKMYHIENGRKYIGEKFDLHKAKEICERYKGVLPSTVTYCDIYIVINSHYHDYITLYKSWFGDNVDCKIIESAIVFWFMDDDYQYEKKVEKFYMD